jgi:hypothetical protein
MKHKFDSFLLGDGRSHEHEVKVYALNLFCYHSIVGIVHILSLLCISVLTCCICDMLSLSHIFPLGFTEFIFLEILSSVICSHD